MNKIKYITQDREAGNVIDEFATRAEAEAAIRAYEEEDRANGCYEENFYAIKEPVVATDCGDHTLVAFIAEGGDADAKIELYVGRDDDGYYNLIASDNASMWIVGNEDDAELNRKHWDLIAERIGEIDFDEIRAINSDLADWLEDRKDEAAVEVNYEVWRIPNGRIDDWRRGITSGCQQIGDDYADIEDARRLRDDCAEDDERFACTHHIRRASRNNNCELIAFEEIVG